MALVPRTAKWVVREDGPAFTFGPADALVPRRAEPGDERGDAVARLVLAGMPDDGQEHLVAVALDAHGVPLAFSRVATGSVDNCPLFARDVYAWALTVPCVRFVGVAHNHPSGDVTPSHPDVMGSALVAKAGAMLALELVWSMVVTHTHPGVWALVPASGKAPEPGEREPHAPKDPDEDPEPEPEPDGDEDGDPGDGDEGDEPDGEDESDGDEDAPEPDEDGNEKGDAPDPDAPEDAPPASAPGMHPTADADALRAAVKAAFKLA